MTEKKLRKQYCIDFKSLDFTSKEANKKLKKNSICIIKNIVHKKDVNFLFNCFKKKFKKIKEKRISGPWKYKMKDFRRVDIGDSYKNSRFSRTITFCEWNKNVNFYKVIKPVIQIRNILSKVEKEGYFYNNLIPYQKKKINKKEIFCDLIRMLQYPTGGGFLSQHDDVDPKYPEKIVNAILTITSRRKNKKNTKLNSYERGGLYFIKNKKKMNVEDMMDPGDLILFDSKIPHGVNSVDPHREVSLNSLNGRISLAFSIGSFVR